MGVSKVKVSQGEGTVKLPLYVVEGRGPTLLGRDWLRNLQIDWLQVRVLLQDKSLKALLNATLLKKF